VVIGTGKSFFAGDDDIGYLVAFAVVDISVMNIADVV
jgi:hypothetical protein